ncbi:acylphosphatase [Neorhodopirellula lusitana]|uniref:acylphosphatase n=2 Tax=Neorhodopirellula lusitana TaxID=445327 RepID=A0ABY1PW53_9BACT|nr:acylphosphatase [Neorhodopirellula lusitana]
MGTLLLGESAFPFVSSGSLDRIGLMANQQEVRRTVYRYRGHVQGVGFRVNAIQQARGLQVVGFVRNEPDGDVLMDVQGPRKEVEELAKRVQSSMSLKINEVLIDQRDPLPDREGFKIRY